MDLLLFSEAHWNWVSLAMVLLVIELVSFSAVFIWFSAAAFITAFVTFIFGISPSLQLAIFSLSTIAGVIGYRHFFKTEPDEKTVNKGASKHIGKTLTVVADFTDGKGRVKLADTSWRASGGDFKSGDKVKVVGEDAGTLLVELKAKEKL